MSEESFQLRMKVHTAGYNCQRFWDVPVLTWKVEIVNGRWKLIATSKASMLFLQVEFTDREMSHNEAARWIPRVYQLYYILI